MDMRFYEYAKKLATDQLRRGRISQNVHDSHSDIKQKFDALKSKRKLAGKVTTSMISSSNPSILSTSSAVAPIRQGESSSPSESSFCASFRQS